jgi:hypothetical protein
LALAGSGIGGVFNLGVSNSVNAKTALSGSTGAPQLAVTNTSTSSSAYGFSATNASSAPAIAGTNNANGLGVSASSTSGIGVLAVSGSATQPGLRARNKGGGPAADFTVNSGLAPFTVSSQTKVNNLNADLVDGFHVNQIMSGGGRVAQASNENLFSIASTDTRATVTLVAPNNGFVLLQGTIIFYDGVGPYCVVCFAVVYLHDVGANLDSPMAEATLGDDATAEHEQTIPVQWVFPVTAGTHQYTLTTGQSAFVGGPANFYNPVLTAEYIPFGYNGGSTLAAEGENTVATPTQSDVHGVNRRGS